MEWPRESRLTLRETLKQFNPSPEGYIAIMLAGMALFVGSFPAKTGLAALSEYLSSRPVITRESIPDRNGDGFEEIAVKADGVTQRVELSHLVYNGFPDTVSINYVPESWFK